MLSNLKIGTKLFAGFGVVTGVLAVLGITCLIMFGSVGSKATSMDKHNLAAVQNSTGVERKAFECILGEKKYLLDKKEEIQKQAMTDLASLNKYLDEVDVVAKAYDDEALAKKSKDVRGMAEQWGKLYNQGVAAIKLCDEAYAVMGAKGVSVGKEADNYMASKKTEYLEAKTALAIVNKIVNCVWEMRYSRQKLNVEKDKKYVEYVAKMADIIEKYCDELGKLHPDETEKQQIAAAIKTAKSYSEVTAKYAEELLKNASSEAVVALDKANSEAGTSLIKTANEYLNAKQAKVDKIADAVFIVADVAQTAPVARLCAIKYMLDKRPEDFKAMLTKISSLDALYEDLRKVSLTNDDNVRIESADKATQEYLAAANGWKANDSKLYDEILPAMKTGGEAVIKNAQTAENDAWTAAGDAVASVNSIVSFSSYMTIFALIFGVVIGCTAAFVITKGITKPVNQVVANLRDIAEGEGDLTKRLEVTGKDEIGALAHWFNTFLNKLQTTVSKVATNAQTLSGASQELSSTAAQLASGAEETTKESATVAAAAEQMSANMRNISASTEEMSTNVRVVASSIEELTSSIGEVAKSAEQAASVADNAASLANVSNQKIDELGSAANEIGKVIEVIQDIAEQTNLLALNATIEAARAGEAGKGFAVVATEVKELAKQTATATEDIRQRIESIQGCTNHTVHAIGEISEVIKKVNEVSRVIASAVEEQSITTKEIARNVAQTAQAADTVSKGVAESATASQEITRTIVSVDQAARQSSQGAALTQRAGQNLSSLSSDLQSLMGQFKV